MPTLGPIPFDSSYDHTEHEPACRDLWETHQVHRFDPHGEGEIFAVDTPPPYVSAAHLHVGHAMSYTQAEILVRWHRMKGRRPFYPMGFDDNGLPTERYVQRVHGIDPATLKRSEFRALCLKETQEGAKTYEALWRDLGLSVDWSLRYSTIDAHCQRTAQRSFVELHRAGRIVRRDEPVLWDPEMRTALAQADIETKTRRTKLFRIHFRSDDGSALTIATTRPELLPGCVALYHHPDDERYAGLSQAIEPLQQRRIGVHTDTEVDPDFGTGLMMVCTFGDADDVRRWRRDGLPLRSCIGADGHLTELAGPYAGLAPTQARKRIVADLQAAGAVDGFSMTEGMMPTSERSGAGVEWQVIPQWSLRLLDLKDALLGRSAQLRWHPPFMKPRLDHWIEGLAWDWTLSRQRSYGVPVPAWLCQDCGEAVLPELDDLPVDPTETPPPTDTCPSCGGALDADPDVLDTWMTSSMTPQINSNWVGTQGRSAGPFPMGVRVQAFEIIRTWLFYTLLKAHLHHDDLPWRDVVISGWGLNEQGRKISKRDLASSTDASGFNRYDPAQVIGKFGADALRHWAGSGNLGHDMRYHAKQVKAGRRVVVKLWNAARLAALSLNDFDPDAPRTPAAQRPPEDRHLLAALDALTREVDRGLAAHDYASGLRALDTFLFQHFCDDWLEGIKDRLAQPESFPEGSRLAAQQTLYEALRRIVGLYAPYLPFVTEAIWQRLFQPSEGGPSVHTTTFPQAEDHPPVPEMAIVRQVLGEVRRRRTEQRLPQSHALAAVHITGPAALLRQIESLRPTLRAACRARDVQLVPTESSQVNAELAIGLVLDHTS
ncbi:MAG: valine--tRNA ligase [Myxococcales bacterium]|nr:valine--tRNA ligase [Myxococcales bacterium]